MDKAFGLRGKITPQSVLEDITEEHIFGSILVSVKNGIFEVGYDKEEEVDKAKKIANTLIASWSKRNNIKIEVNFNQSWRLKLNGNKLIGINLCDGIGITDCVVTNTVTIQGKARIVKQSTNSYSFADDIDNVWKAEKDETLMLALKYFYDEVIGSKRPMYGIHKAIEQIIKHLPGKNEKEKRSELATKTGHDKSYIDDLMTSIQTQRHSEEWLRLKKIGKIIEDQECIERAKNLIDGYAASLTK